MPFNSIVSRADADPLIPDDVADETIAAATQESAALSLFRRVSLGTKITSMPVLSALPVAYWVNGGGYRDPRAKAFIESWFSKLKLRCIWRHEFETLEQARAAIGIYVDRYHHHPHTNLYRTPSEVAQTWKITTTT